MQQHPIASIGAPAGQDDTDSGFLAFVLSKADGVFQKCDDLPKFLNLMDRDTARGLLLYEPPAECLAKRLASGNAGSAVLDQWATGAMAYLKVRRKLPNRLVILEKPIDPTALAVVTAAFEKAFPGAAIPFSTPLSNRAEPFYGALAALAVAQHAIAGRLHAELQASAGTSFQKLPDTDNSLQSACAAWERLMADRDGMEAAQSRTGTDISALRAELDSAQRQEAAARSELEAAVAAKAQANLQRLIGGQLKDIEGELARLHTENETLNETVDKITAREIDAQAALRNARDELTRAKSSEIDARAASLHARDELARAKTGETEARAALQSARDDLARAKTGETDARTELRIVSDNLDRARASEIEARTHLAIMERDLDAARADDADARGRLSAVLNELSTITADRDAAQQELQKLRGEQEQRALSESVLTGQIKQLEGELRHAETLHASTRSDLEQARLRENERNAELEQVRTREKERQSEQDHSRQQIETILTEQVRQLTGELQQTGQLQFETLRKTRELETKIKQTELRQAEAVQAKAQAEQSVESLSYELSLVYASSSWRMTKPLRFFRRVFGGADTPPENESKT